MANRSDFGFVLFINNILGTSCISQIIISMIDTRLIPTNKPRVPPKKKKGSDELT